MSLELGGLAQAARLPRVRLAEMDRGYSLVGGWRDDGTLAVREVCEELAPSEDGIVGGGRGAGG